ncbi:hypothetical protein [Nocardia sp. NPDC051981]|uniref:hypothetical protein n=1 Tax=Nocardia sp. NPDC051981 TaxID=3155417 RepID=UPI0034424A3E
MTTTPADDTARLRSAAQRALESLDDLIANTTDPGVEALGARSELATALINTSPEAARQILGDQGPKGLKPTTARLDDGERQFLSFALDLAADEMASRGDEFTDEDRAALETLRRMAALAVTEVPRAAADLLAACATEYRVPVPEHGGTELRVRRQELVHGLGWAVMVPGYGGGRAWTREGWQEAISALCVDRLFCWPNAATAVDEARRALGATEEPTR